MTSKLSLPTAIVALLSLALAPSAMAVGISGPHAVAKPSAIASASTLIAPAAACPGQTRLNAPAEAQEKAMLCLTDFARANAGLEPLAASPQLELSAQDKLEDVLRCDSFSHFACGRDFTYWMRETGYVGDGCWHVGENLAWGSGEYGSVRSIFRAWMSSPTHRRNILGDYEEAGAALLGGDLEGRPDAHLWAVHFGSRYD